MPALLSITVKGCRRRAGAEEYDILMSPERKPSDPVRLIDDIIVKSKISRGSQVDLLISCHRLLIRLKTSWAPRNSAFGIVFSGILTEFTSDCRFEVHDDPWCNQPSQGLLFLAVPVLRRLW